MQEIIAIYFTTNFYYNDPTRLIYKGYISLVTEGPKIQRKDDLKKMSESCTAPTRWIPITSEGCSAFPMEPIVEPSAEVTLLPGSPTSESSSTGGKNDPLREFEPSEPAPWWSKAICQY